MSYKQVTIGFDTLPRWAQDEVTTYLGPNRGNNPIYLQLCEGGEAHVGGVTDEYSRRRVVGRNGQGETVYLDSMYYESLTVATPREKAAYFGGKQPLPLDGAILTIVDGYKCNPTRLYVHADGPYARLADNQPTGDELTPLQLAVLQLYVGLNTGGRKWEMDSKRIPPALVKETAQELAELGLFSITRNGAVRKTLRAHQIHDNSRYDRADWPALIKEWRLSR